MNSTELVHWFRQSTPYVNMHRGKTFVLMLDGNTIASPNFLNIISDISLLHSLGIKLVIVFGAQQQINQRLQQQGIEPVYYNNTYISDLATLDLTKQVVGHLQYDISARLSLRLPHSPTVNVISGNFISAQPIGVVDGIDHMLSGKIRRIDSEAIQLQLQNNAIVLISQISQSVTGETFNLSFEEIAAQVAIKLKAEKLIGFCQSQGILDQDKKTIPDLLPQQVSTYLQQFIKENQHLSSQAKFLQAASQVCKAGVKRSHLISYEEDGSLLQELFTRNGVGTQISMESSEIVRTATVADIPGLIELIHPLEQQGVLVKRSREQLEMDIANYTIFDRDGVVIACAALNQYPQEKMAEMACVAVHPDYRNSSRGDNLLEQIEKRARKLGIEKLFVLTTRTVHWFQERGFQLAQVEDLPAKKRANYNYQRRSKILIKPL